MKEVVELPAELMQEAGKSFARIKEACDRVQLSTLSSYTENTVLEHQVFKALAVSEFLGSLWRKSPYILINMLDSASLFQSVSKDYFKDKLSQKTPANKEELDKCLRIFRQQEMSRFIFRLVNNLATTMELVDELSEFAGACIDMAYQWHYRSLIDCYGTPVGAESGEQQHLVILGMGKLGAHELNLSSDIDLIFAYPEAGQTSGNKSIDNHRFFLKLGQSLIKTLDKITAEGFVFRVDMRLRPYGSSGALALNFDAMELYYEDQGREWERYAMIKARCVAGDLVKGKELLEILRPFVYRRYTDFSVIQSLRDMKDMINREVRRIGKENDVKLGAGGIREIEFIAQSYQLIYGGRDEDLQSRHLLDILSLLSKKGLLPENTIENLKSAYLFLRDSEHVIQAIRDEQTQRLPDKAIDRERLALVMGFDNFEGWNAQYILHRTQVRECFEGIVAEEISDSRQKDLAWCRETWLEADEQLFAGELESKGFSEIEISRLLAFRQNPKLIQLSPMARERLNTFMPLLLSSLLEFEDRGPAVDSLLDLVDAVLRRTAYLVLFNENPHALFRLIDIARASQWIMQQLVRHPVLMDEVVASGGLGHVPEPSELRDSLQQQGLRLEIDDTEGHMGMLRYFKLAHHLHIVAAESSGDLPLMKVSDYLSYVAEAILEYVLQIAWTELTKVHGFPSGKEMAEANFAIIAYGKLGGIELTHTSDLDLVFIYDDDDQAMTNGAKPLENRVFFTRLGKRIIHFLGARTMLGQLYEVDMRLRPSGAKGLLVSSLQAFEKYQKEQAWTWEHQALVRGRAVAGNLQVRQGFEQVRYQVLTRARDRKQLKQEVIDMREKMFQHLVPGDMKADDAGVFHLKHSRGGIVDIEFIVQYLVLAWSGEYPELVTYTDNMRILDTLKACQLLTDSDVDKLQQAYVRLRTEVHRLALLQQENRISRELIDKESQAVIAIWQKLFA